MKRGSSFHSNVERGQQSKGRRWFALLNAFIAKPYSRMLYFYTSIQFETNLYKHILDNAENQKILRKLSNESGNTAIGMLLDGKKWKLGMFFADYVYYCCIGMYFILCIRKFALYKKI